MANHSIQRNQIDVIALESKHQSEFERSLTTEEFSRNYKEKLRNTFEDGQWDGYLDMMPEPHQWSVNSYRSGYLSGVAQKFDEQFSFVSL